VIQPRAAGLATATRVPIVFAKVEAAGLRLNSWDHFLIPWPFARVVVRYWVWRPEEGPFVLPAELRAG
jgi:lysophospholipid acyltransferase (LPLAT)-like uncharacterized protein